MQHVDGRAVMSLGIAINHFYRYHFHSHGVLLIPVQDVYKSTDIHRLQCIYHLGRNYDYGASNHHDKIIICIYIQPRRDKIEPPGFVTSLSSYED